MIMKYFLLISFFVALVAANAAIGGGLDDPEKCVKCCESKAKPCKPKIKVVTKEIKVPVEKIVEKEVEKIVEKPAQCNKNTIAIVFGGGIDRIGMRKVANGVTEVYPKNTTLIGARYTRDIDNEYEIGIEGMTTYDRLVHINSFFETGAISLGFKF